MKHFRDDGVCRIGPKQRRGQVVQQHGMHRVHRAGRDGITETDVDLGLGVIVFFEQIDTVSFKNINRDKHLRKWHSGHGSIFGAN